MAEDSGGPGTAGTVVGEIRADRSGLRRLEVFLTGRGPWFAILVGLILIALVGLVDVLTSSRFSVAVLYLVPIGLATFARGRIVGALMAAATAIAFGAVEIAVGITGLDSVVTYVNVLSRFFAFEIVSLLVAWMRDAMLRERELAARETEAAERLRALNALKDTLLHAVSHDLMGPIAAIRGSVTTLARAEELRLSPEQRDGLIQAIDASAGRVERLVGDLLDLERLEHGAVDLDRRATDVGALAEELMAEGDMPADHPVLIEADPVLVEVDRAMVERILDNLLKNAAKHTPAGTTIRVRVAARTGGVDLSVEDDGPGVPDSLKDIIFEPFRRGDPSAAGRGVGIGLSLVAKFAQLHGGRTWVRDREGGGSAFVVSLPGVVTPGIQAATSADDEPPVAEAG